jgi:putative hydrolase of the HAD superfamily
MTVRAVAFDLDYTLAVPERDRQTLLDEATEAVGAPAMSREAYLDAHVGHLTRETREPIFERLLDEHGTARGNGGAGAREDGTSDGADPAGDADPAALARAYRERVSGALRPVPGVEAMLEGLRAEYRVGLLTNGPTVAQRDKLVALGWTDAFDVALVTGDLEAGKPDPASFEALLDALGSRPDETVFVGDDVEADVGGAAGVGIHPVQVTFPGSAAPDARAVAHLDRDRLASELPPLVASL